MHLIGLKRSPWSLVFTIDLGRDQALTSESAVLLVEGRRSDGSVDAGSFTFRLSRNSCYRVVDLNLHSA